MGDDGSAADGRVKWVPDPNPPATAGGGDRFPLLIVHHLTPCLLCHLCRQQQQRQMTTQQRAWQPLAGDINVDGGGDREGGGQPVTTATNIFPPMPTAPPSTISISFSPGLSTADVVNPFTLVGDCG
jgi:hypothetical protein